MKTCPNPKCKATGIPEDAQYCPKCGTKLVSLFPNEFLFGPYGTIDNGDHCVDIRQVERISDVGKYAKIKLCDNISPLKRFIRIYLKEDKRFYIFLCDNHVSYIHFIPNAKRTNDDVYEFRCCFYDELISFAKKWGIIPTGNYVETGKIISEVTYHYNYIVMRDGIECHEWNEMDEHTWWQKYSKEFYDYLAPYQELLTELFGIDPISTKYWKW